MIDHCKFISKRIKGKHIIAIIISVIILCLAIGSLLKINYGEKEANYTAEKGVIDLRGWNMNEEEIINLDGEWEFYSGELLTSKDEFNKDNMRYIKVPGTWNSYLQGKGIENGSGTYRLIIKLPEDGVYAIKARTIRTANRIFINGKEVANAGNPALSRQDIISDSKYNIGMGNSLEGKIELIVHATSLEFRSGGIIKSIELGSVSAITNADKTSLLLDAIVVSVCLVLGIYFFLIFLQRDKDLYLLYYSGSSLFMGLNLSTMNEQVLRVILDYDLMTRTRIQLLSMIMVTLCLLRFVYYFFIDYSNKKTSNRISLLLLALLLTMVNDPAKPVYIPVGNIQIITLMGLALGYGYIFYILIKAIQGGGDSLEYILVITTSMFSYWLLLGLKTFLELELGNIPVMLIIMTLFGVAALMSHHLHLDYQEARDISNKMIRYDELKDDFLIKSSHELRLPLESILYSIKNLLEGDKGPLNAEQQEDLLLIFQEGKKLIRLADDLQDASLIKRDKLNMRLTAVDPYKIVEAIVEEVEILIPINENVLIKNQITKDFPALYADSDKFRQIIYDLLHNAIKYTKSGEIIISASLLNGQAKIKVRDTGIGIEEKYQKEIFDKFFQKGVEGQDKGLGLGLSIVKHLVEIQGGNIIVESIYGEGSNFIFTLPIYDKNMEEVKIMYDDDNEFVENVMAEISSLVEKNKQNNSEDINILIVDDEILNQKILSEVISELNYNITIANKGKEALGILKENKIDLIILDFMLPDVSASELCKQIRLEYSMAELPILILTQSGRTLDRMSTFNFGANDFQKKPIDHEELKSRVQSLLLMKTSVEMALEKEFQYFYSQISPHFLYNTLNSIIGISYIDSEKARKGLNNLAIYFRGKLDIHRKKGLVPLESELELVSAYLGIEELRYGERLEVEYEVVEGLSAMIPPLTLQTIVENSVNHGLSVKDGGGKIRISTKKEANGFMRITIEDNGIGMTLEKQEELLKGTGKGIGFKNAMERVKIIRGASLILKSKLNEGTKVEIIIPEVKDYENNIS